MRAISGRVSRTERLEDRLVALAKDKRQQADSGASLSLGPRSLTRSTCCLHVEAAAGAKCFHRVYSFGDRTNLRRINTSTGEQGWPNVISNDRQAAMTTLSRRTFRFRDGPQQAKLEASLNAKLLPDE